MDPLVGQLILQVVLIAINAFFASAEIALISLDENKLQRSAEEGDKKAAQLLKMVQVPASMLSTIQVGITLAGFLGSAFAADNLASRLTDWLVNTQHVTWNSSTVGTISVIVITLILSYFTLVFGELVPKRVAMQRKDRVARMASSVIYGLSKAMRPIIWFLSVSTNAILRLMRIDPHANEDEVTEEEIRLMVDIGRQRGAIDEQERELIENVFEFNDRTAKDVMIHRTDVVAVADEDTDEEILDTIKTSGLSRLPYCHEDMDEIKGILIARDFLINLQSETPRATSDLLRPAYFVPDTVHANELFKDMQVTKNHIAVVVDEFGGTSGIVTMEDLLEELVGNIYDEFDPTEKPDIAKIGENLWRVSGNVEIEELEKILDIEIPPGEDYDTLGGLVFSKLNAIPADGSKFDIEADGLKISVQEVQNRRVESAFVSVLPRSEDENGENK